MKDAAKIALRLIVITVIAGLLLGLTYSSTKDPIAQQEALKASESRRVVLNDAADFEQIDLAPLNLPEEYGVIQEAYRGINNGETVGITVYMIVTGYSKGLNITVGIKNDGTVAGVDIGSHSETAGLGANAGDPTYLAQYTGLTPPANIVKTAPQNPGDVQAVTGATITSRAVADAVNLAAQFYTDYVREGESK
jgi:electron transport complex protein RnfG